MWASPHKKTEGKEEHRKTEGKEERVDHCLLVTSCLCIEVMSFCVFTCHLWAEYELYSRPHHFCSQYHV